jgi:hypothetical protein
VPVSGGQSCAFAADGRSGGGAGISSTLTGVDGMKFNRYLYDADLQPRGAVLARRKARGAQVLRPAARKSLCRRRLTSCTGNRTEVN